MILSYRGRTPRIAPSAFIAPTAAVIGDVTIGEEASVWFGAVLRGDVGPIEVAQAAAIYVGLSRQYREEQRPQVASPLREEPPEGAGRPADAGGGPVPG